MSTPKQAPIGIFDSGIGGLTVVKSVMNLLPNEHIIYFGDTARVPYGIKSTETIRQYALQITDFLLKKNVKMILIACNSVAAAATSEIKKKSGHVPVLDVIEAGTLAALSHSKSTRHGVGVIGTLATIGSGAYEEALHRQNTDIQVFSRACPLLVPLAEEGWTDNSIALDVLETYLKDFQSKNLDAMILGCTHYPLFKKGISQILGEKIKIIDSAESIAVLAREHLEKAEQLHNGTEGSFHCYVSDKPQRFKLLAERFLGKKLNRVEIVNPKG